MTDISGITDEGSRMTTGFETGNWKLETRDSVSLSRVLPGIPSKSQPANCKSKIQNPKSKIPQGFTLLEILISIFILGVVVSTVFGTFNTVFSTADRILESGASDFEMAKNCLNRMIVDLKSIYVSPYAIYKTPELDSEPDPYRIVGETVNDGGSSFGRLRFTSTAHCPFQNSPEDGIAEIIYYVQKTNGDTFALRRSDRLEPYLPFEPSEKDPMLFDGIRSLSFTFYDDEGEAYDRWDSEQEEFDYSTPKAVRIQLVFEEGEAAPVLETKILLPVFREKKE
ncbi:MAG TPA: prepilin-type N-terminal cleavage/methylation domain-containing protein [Deltaproteobacteria bacterium]|nr:prepilin-type N-terminal cleavage/methylation domain-containing protein [Deltaproteobacteria bacterium]